MEVCLIELEHEHEPLTLVKIIHVAGVLELAKHTNARGVPTGAILLGDESGDGGIDPTKTGGVVEASEGEGINFLLCVVLPPDSTC